MANFFSFLKANWLVILLAVGIVVMSALYSSRSKKNSQQTLVAPAPAWEYDQSAGRTEAPSPNNIEFCFRLDGNEGGHLPHLIIGRLPEKVYSNGISGYNWALLPNSTGSENYGILPDGTFFLKEAFARECGMKSFVDIKTDATGWQPVRMELAVVGGEPAFIYKK